MLSIMILTYVYTYMCINKLATYTTCVHTYVYYNIFNLVVTALNVATHIIIYVHTCICTYVYTVPIVNMLLLIVYVVRV